MNAARRVLNIIAAAVAAVAGKATPERTPLIQFHATGAASSATSVAFVLFGSSLAPLKLFGLSPCRFIEAGNIP